jgi:2Fe-2S ferredoxin
MPHLTFIDAAGGRHEVEAPCGRSVMQIAREHDLVEGACGGEMACATCHVIVEPADALRLRAPCPEEEDMLDLATGVQPTSRLGCQIVLCEELDGLTVHLPVGALSPPRWPG